MAGERYRRRRQDHPRGSIVHPATAVLVLYGAGALSGDHAGANGMLGCALLPEETALPAGLHAAGVAPGRVKFVSKEFTKGYRSFQEESQCSTKITAAPGNPEADVNKDTNLRCFGYLGNLDFPAESSRPRVASRLKALTGAVPVENMELDRQRYRFVSQARNFSWCVTSQPLGAKIPNVEFYVN